MRAAGDWPAACHQKQFWLDYLFAEHSSPPMPVPMEEVPERLPQTLEALEHLSTGEISVDAPYPDLAGCQIEFRVSDEAALVLELDEWLGYTSLSLSHTSIAEMIELGWDDQGHFHPYALRWEELEAICRCLAAGNPRTPHPGATVLLLHRFAQMFLADGVDLPAILAIIEHAARSLDLFSEGEIGLLLALYRGRATVANHWAWDEQKGWLLEGEGAYSLRNAENATFPFALLHDMVEQARRCANGN